MKARFLLLVSTLIAPISLFPLQAYAEAPAQTAAGESAPAEQTLVEATLATTTGSGKKEEERTLEMILDQIESREVALYNLFNELNSSDEYDISCASHTDENSERPMQICEPAFLEKIRLQNREEIENGSMKDVGLLGRLRETFFGPWELSDEEIRARAEEPIRLVQEEFEALATANPELRAELQLIGGLQQEFFELAEETRRRDPSFMWQNEPGYRNAHLQERQAVNPKPWLSAPPPGHTQPQIHFGHGDLSN